MMGKQMAQIPMELMEPVREGTLLPRDLIIWYELAVLAQEAHPEIRKFPTWVDLGRNAKQLAHELKTKHRQLEHPDMTDDQRDGLELAIKNGRLERLGFVRVVPGVPGGNVQVLCPVRVEAEVVPGQEGCGCKGAAQIPMELIEALREQELLAWSRFGGHLDRIACRARDCWSGMS